MKTGENSPAAARNLLKLCQVRWEPSQALLCDATLLSIA